MLSYTVIKCGGGNVSEFQTASILVGKKLFSLCIIVAQGISSINVSIGYIKAKFA